MQIKSNELIDALQARVVRGALPESLLLRVGTDSRRIETGMIFFALQGESYDGHDYTLEALASGAAVAVVSRPLEIPLNAQGAVLLMVEDVLDSMQSLARVCMERSSVVSTAVTGSVGKTTTKDLTAHFLNTRYSTLKTQANYNNDIGLPLTVFSLEAGHERAVFEMAMRGRGEIRRLARMIRPQYAIITNVAPVHLETLGSLEEIAAAKCELLQEMPVGGTALINCEQELLVRTARSIRPEVMTFGGHKSCDSRVVKVESHPRGMRMHLEVLGRELLLEYPIPAPLLAPNFAAAALCASLQGVDLETIKASLAGFSASDKRLKISNFDEGGAIINDSYNASPLSMSSALSTLMIKAGGRRTIAVLGDMFELGSLEAAAHQSLGREAAECGVNMLVCVGDRAIGIANGALANHMPADRVYHFSDLESAGEFLLSQLDRTDFVLFKASRAMQFERLAELFTGYEE